MGFLFSSHLDLQIHQTINKKSNIYLDTDMTKNIWVAKGDGMYCLMESSSKWKSLTILIERNECINSWYYIRLLGRGPSNGNS